MDRQEIQSSEIFQGQLLCGYMLWELLLLCSGSSRECLQRYLQPLKEKQLLIWTHHVSFMIFHPYVRYLIHKSAQFFFFFFSLLRMFNSVCDGIRQLSFCCLIWCVSSARSVLAPFCGFDFELDTHSRRRARGCVFDVWSSVSALGIKSQIDRSVKKR